MNIEKMNEESQAQQVTFNEKLRSSIGVPLDPIGTTTTVRLDIQLSELRDDT